MSSAELLAEILRWGVPALVVVVVAGIVVVAIGWAVRAARRSPRARAAADQARTKAGVDLVQLDDAVGELDLEVGLSGALYGGSAPASLRRSRMTAQHVRDDAFGVFRTISDDDSLLPAEVQRRARLISTRVDEAMAAIAHARTEHAQWMQENTSAADQITSARGRLATVREQMGDPRALLAELRERYDEAEWRDAAASATAAVAHADEAAELLDRAAASASDPSRSALSDLALAERRIRSAQSETRRLEEVHGLITQAVQSLPGEFDATRSAVRQAMAVREHLEPDAAARLGTAIHDAESSLAALQRDAARRPTETVDGIARLRDRLDLALGDARTAQQRLRGAHSALTGTIAAAQSAVARAEASATRSGVDARVRLASAQDELAKARQLPDPVEALDAARRAMRHAEDAQALAAYDRMTSGR
ncbi:hypothetical protein ET475_06905 [Microbacterium protaetiae]|uniref:Uncharacterized protein n=1 Tax=Microbacterium protaetiae TaxID=2509458 RepID=A0A4P6ECG8_9MICO|nr:hypothetical protein [Microbacterium protaetiae]QAY59744.1 hypothetical protein ET475_06905 [Microbacterium protaetiae]